MSDTESVSGDRKRRLGAALRRNEGRRLLPKFLADAAEKLRVSDNAVRVVDASKTEELRRVFESRAQAVERGAIPSFRGKWRASEAQAVTSLLEKLRGTSFRAPMFLFLPLSPYCGAIEVTSTDLLERALDLVRLDQDDAAAMSDDGSYAIRLQYHTDWSKDGGIATYEIELWGDAWVKAVNAHCPSSTTIPDA